MRNADAEESAREFNGGGCWGADGNNFDADMYLERLMTERSLRDLTKKNESMDKGAWHAHTRDRRASVMLTGTVSIRLQRCASWTAT